MEKTSDSPFLQPPFDLIRRGVAETLVLLEYVTSRPEGAQWAAALGTPENYKESSQTGKIEQDLRTPTTIVRKIYEIRTLIAKPFYETDWDWASDLAFLSRAKSILSELAAPATSLTIAFTSMVVDAQAGLGGPKRLNPSDVLEDPIAEIAFPAWIPESYRLARSVGFIVPWLIGIVTVGLLVVAWAAHSESEFVSERARMTADVAVQTGILPGFLGLLGALASILRRFQLLVSARLLDPGLRSRNRIEIYLGFIAGLAVGFLGAGFAPTPFRHLAVASYAAAFLAGYSTEIAFSLVDSIILRFSRLPVFQERTAQIKTVIKTQTVIENAVKKIDGQIEQIRGNVTLDFFKGRLIVQIADSNGNRVQIEPHDVAGAAGASVKGVRLSPGGPYAVLVKLDRENLPFENAIIERVVTGPEGEDAQVAVSFDIALNARDIHFAPKKQTIELGATSTSSDFNAYFNAPTKTGRYEIFVEISQKNRLVQVAVVPAFVEGSDA